MPIVRGKKETTGKGTWKQNANPLVSRGFMVLSSAAMLFFGAPFLQDLHRERELGKASLSWPSTVGLVTQCEYHKGSRRSPYATITYRYSINGHDYSSGQVTVAKDYYRGDPRKFVQEHPVGSKIPVYYDQSHSSSCVLDRGIDPESNVFFFFAGMALLLVVICVSIVVQTLRELFAKTSPRSHA